MILTCYLPINAQDANDFIKSYNKHIDPLNKLDNIEKLELTMTSTLVYEVNSVKRKSKSVRFCSFFSNGKSYCEFSSDKGINKSESFEILKEYGGNSVKKHLNILHISEKHVYTLLTSNDSLTVIEHKKNETDKTYYTFKSQTLDLKQVKRISVVNDEFYEAITDYVSYQVIDNIVTPKVISFKNNRVDSEIIYSDVKFVY